jgi:hypothetical protein
MMYSGFAGLVAVFWLPAVLPWPAGACAGDPGNTVAVRASDSNSEGAPANASRNPETIRPADRRSAVFQRELHIGLGSRKNAASFRVPAGKRLVIEHVSVSAKLPFGQNLLVEIETTVDGRRARHFLVPAWPDYARFTGVDMDLVRLRQSIRAYADGGANVRAIAARTGNWGAGSAAVTISGYLLDK